MILSNINKTVHVVTSQIGLTSLHLCIMNQNPAFLFLLQRPCYSPHYIEDITTQPPFITSVAKTRDRL